MHLIVLLRSVFDFVIRHSFDENSANRLNKNCICRWRSIIMGSVAEPADRRNHRSDELFYTQTRHVGPPIRPASGWNSNFGNPLDYRGGCERIDHYLGRHCTRSGGTAAQRRNAPGCPWLSHIGGISGGYLLSRRDGRTVCQSHRRWRFGWMHALSTHT